MWDEESIYEDVINDVYDNFDEGLEDDEMSPEEAAFMQGYMEMPE
jgi:hypothetical protein